VGKVFCRFRRRKKILNEAVSTLNANFVILLRKITKLAFKEILCAYVKKPKPVLWRPKAAEYDSIISLSYPTKAVFSGGRLENYPLHLRRS
jgi:hypothetical protein